MGALQRFQAVMAVFFLLCAAVSLWRIAACDGRDIWYIPLVLLCASGVMAVGAQGKKPGKGKKGSI